MNNESELSKYKIELIDSPDELKLSRFAGKPKALITRITHITKSAVKNFFANLLKAIRVIIKGIM